MQKLILILYTIYIFYSIYAFSLPINEEIHVLPGWSGNLPSRQFSGFVNANNDSLHMHYWFIEAEDDINATKPLLLWFNGGPGASSLYGLLVEMGPFILNDLSRIGKQYEETRVPQLQYNTYGWQKLANILALSMPPPIGFSYCDPIGPSASHYDCGSWNDTSTAQVTYYAIKSWLSKFPEYNNRDIYIAGESYAGIYIPEIVKEVLQDVNPINLIGFAIGNGCTPPAICGKYDSAPYWRIEFLFGKSAFSNQLYEDIHTICTLEELTIGESFSSNCKDILQQMENEVGGYWYYGYYDDCWYENDIRRRLTIINDTEIKPYYGPPIVNTNSIDYTNIELSDFGSVQGYPCGGPGAQMEYLALPQVIEALNLPSNANFFQSDNGIGFEYITTETDLVSWYKEIIPMNKFRILIYNGDTDPCINVFVSQNWTRSLDLKESQSWRPWTLDNCQRMAGHVTRYVNNFDFITIKGSGHMVPQNKPQVAFEMMKNYLNNNDYKVYNSSCIHPIESSQHLEENSLEISRTQRRIEQLEDEMIKLHQLKDKMQYNNNNMK